MVEIITKKKGWSAFRPRNGLKCEFGVALKATMIIGSCGFLSSGWRPFYKRKKKDLILKAGGYIESHINYRQFDVSL